MNLNYFSTHLDRSCPYQTAQQGWAGRPLLPKRLMTMRIAGPSCAASSSLIASATARFKSSLYLKANLSTAWMARWRLLERLLRWFPQNKIPPEDGQSAAGPSRSSRVMGLGRPLAHPPVPICSGWEITLADVKRFLALLLGGLNSQAAFL